MTVNNNLSWPDFARSISQPGMPSRPSSLLTSSLGSVPITPTPAQPSATNYSRVREAEQRFEKRLQRLREVLPIRPGRVVPDDDDLMIGDARRLKLAVLFVDICKFSQIPSFKDYEQDAVLTLLNLFMAEMLQVVKMHGGDFEKNTGDGLMAYFKDGSEAESTQCAVDAAVTMHCYNDRVISPRLKAAGFPEIKFRVGIETGTVTIANVGIVGGKHRSLVAIGGTANMACKLMNLIENGGIVMGNYARYLLRDEWKKETTQIGTLPGFVLDGTTNPYPVWELKYRVSNLPNWPLGLYGVLSSR